VYAIAHGIDTAVLIGTTFDKIATIFGISSVQVVVCINSFSLYEYLVKLGTIKKKRLIIDIMIMRQTYERQKISDVR
jgi:hypothetical protein